MGQQPPTGVATGIGSLPGTDIDAAVALVADELPDLPHLPELPARGPGADMVGRAAAVLVDLHVDLQPSGWRLVDRRGVDERRARDLLARDLDALVPVLDGYDGWLKLAVAGPWTLAASLGRPRGEAAVADAGAVRDLVASHAEGVRLLLAEAARRVPGARWVLQLDEPSLPAVLGGRVPTVSGHGRLRAVEAHVAQDALSQVVGAAGVPVAFHCCAPDAPVALFSEAGAAAVSLDVVGIAPEREVLAAAVESGVALWLGVVPALGPGAAPTARATADVVRRLWRELGFAPDRLGDSVVVTPACGLAGASEGWARSAMRLLRQTARVLADAPDGVRL